MRKPAVGSTGLLPLLLLILLLVPILLSAGCLSGTGEGGAPVTTATASPAATTESATVLVTLSAPTLPPAETAAVTTAGPEGSSTTAPAATWVVPTYGATGDPRIIILQFQKEYFNADLPDCGMRKFFPEAATDPNYGIAGRQGTLVAHSEEDILRFLETNAVTNVTTVEAGRRITDYIEPATLGGPACSGMISTPTWNFVLINATIIGRNALPAEYAIGFNVRSKGVVVAQIRADRNLTLDTPALFALYVPLKTAEMERFDSVEMVFARKG
ncbi:hypothetical protein [Methanoregula formicica]|uniref:Uncharacterized protein n=1 Tax=Methanoregula formicica (strain DSM 22288 / NBRC 105244 / SMSP) TaxID=593750 RepID=L0HE99_METFS|nr:hypothetical protein [Methanoregula formicica]AGB02106.1 hypothetical protein Metfor_1057 [Methanoregula formicica SMSP]